MNLNGKANINGTLLQPVLGLTPNSIFMSMRLQSREAQLLSRISNTVTVVLLMMSSSSRPIRTPPTVMLAARHCSKDHWGSWFASSYMDKNIAH